jgi:ribosome-associated protein
MEDIVKSEDMAINVAHFINDHNGVDTIALNIGDKSNFTDIFIITTVTSNAHLKGMLKHLRSYFLSHNIEPYHRQKKVDDNGWVLLDCGDMIIHLMTEEIRTFYELEKLWFTGKTIYQSSKLS